MEGFTALPPHSRQAAIAGKVIDSATRLPLAGVRVAITTMPKSFKERLLIHAIPYGDAWATMAERPDRTRTSADGSFRFMDLPRSKHYKLTFSLPAALRRYGKVKAEFAVDHDKKGRITATPQTIALPATGVFGKVLSGGAPVVLAEIRVIGSGEQAFTGADGAFLLSAMEPGQRRLSISAQGYKPTIVSIEISQGVLANAADIALEVS